MAEPIVVAHLVSEHGARACSAADAPMTVDFTARAWAAHVRCDGTGSVIRCGSCAETLRFTSELSAAWA
jgi:hypothetical protein